MTTVAQIAPHHRALDVPSDLKLLPGWLVWRYEDNGGPKPIKVPYYVSGGRRAGAQGSPADRAKLTTFAIARDVAVKRGFEGVGLAMLPDWGLTALDFDHCVDADGNIPDEIVDIIGYTYSEFSPSQRGIRAFVKGNLGNHKSHAKGQPYGFETFNTSGFVTFTGLQTGFCEIMGNGDFINEVTPPLQALAEKRFGPRTDAPTGRSELAEFFGGQEPRLGLTVERMEELVNALDPDMGRDEWIRVGMALHHECEGDDTGFDVWDEWSSGGATYPGTEGLRTQWASFDRREGGTGRQVTMATVIKMAKEAGAGATAHPTVAASADELSRVAAEASELAPHDGGVRTADGYAGRFPVVSAGDLSRRPPPDWLIKGVLPRADLIVLFGASGSGKSFVGIDLLASIARGTPWRDHRTTRGRAIIIAAEGGGGIGKRLEAYCRHHNINADELDIGVIIAPPNFMLAEDITDLVRSVAAAGGADIIMVDTYAQVTPGANENSAEDMGLALANARALRDATNAVVMLVHHAGKDPTKGSRGWSGIKAAVDAEIEVSRHDDSPVREIRISKMKDGEDGLRWAFKLDILEVGIDGDGDPITSCVVVPAELPPADGGKAKPGKKLGRVETHIVETIEAAVDPFATDMDLEDFVRVCVDGMPAPEPGKRDIRRQDVQRALRSLARSNDAPLAIEHGRVIFLTQ